jgi:type I restriction enzyme S subunit
LFRQAHLLRAANAKVAEVRDLLLPKLVTGMLDVATLDIEALVLTTSAVEGIVA